MKKATWLYFAGVDRSTIQIPLVLRSSHAGDRRRQQLMSHKQRAETCPALAAWLVDYARQSHREIAECR